jgi:hypothetical protein
MIRAKDIKTILGQISTGTTLTVGQKYLLTSEDWEIHTNTRPTNYRKWQHRIQAVLSEYKRKGIVQHHPQNCSYTF